MNETTLTSTRTANVNAGQISGNVLVIAANIAEATPDDLLKIEKLTVQQAEEACYQNYAVVTTGAGGPTDSDVSYYCNPDVPPPVPGIDIEKFTNGVDADTEAEAPEIAPGDVVTWTYKVTNTGTLAFSASEVVVSDDNGTPGNKAFDDSELDFEFSGAGRSWISSAGSTALDEAMKFTAEEAVVDGFGL